MKENELFVGAWITSKKWREKPFKLTRINDSGKYYYGITAEGSIVGPFLIEELEPIPLTAEILEKNGFEKDPESGELIWCDDEVTEVVWIGTILAIHGKNANAEFFTCMFVHQLQHDLRLCGIEKEIEL